MAQYNPLRAATRRSPQVMTSVVQSFDAAKFNFTRVCLETELICKNDRNDHFRTLCQSCGPASSNAEMEPNVRPDDLLDSGPKPHSDLSPTHAIADGADCATHGITRPEASDLILINVSPIDFGHCLLVPSVEECLPQVLTERSVCLALKMTLLSGCSTFKVAFNSLCAYASVNHLHWHLYYLRSHRYVPAAILYTLFGAQTTPRSPNHSWLDTVVGGREETHSLTQSLGGDEPCVAPIPARLGIANIFRA